MTRQSRTLGRRIPSVSCASINGSSSRSDGCRWISGMPVLLPYRKMTWKVVCVTEDLTSRPPRILRHSFLYSRRKMRRTDTSFCRTSGCRKTISLSGSTATMFRMMYGNGRDFYKRRRAMWFTTVTLKNSLNGWANASISARLLSTVGAPYNGAES